MKIIKAKAPQEGTLDQADNIFTFWMLAQMTLCGEIERRYNKYLRYGYSECLERSKERSFGSADL